jgi:hypothetical protein
VVADPAGAVVDEADLLAVQARSRSVCGWVDGRRRLAMWTVWRAPDRACHSRGARSTPAASARSSTALVTCDCSPSGPSSSVPLRLRASQQLIRELLVRTRGDAAAVTSVCSRCFTARSGTLTARRPPSRSYPPAAVIRDPGSSSLPHRLQVRYLWPCSLWLTRQVCIPNRQRSDLLMVRLWHAPPLIDRPQRTEFRQRLKRPCRAPAAGLVASALVGPVSTTFPAGGISSVGQAGPARGSRRPAT